MGLIQHIMYMLSCTPSRFVSIFKDVKGFTIPVGANVAETSMQMFPALPPKCSLAPGRHFQQQREGARVVATSAGNGYDGQRLVPVGRMLHLKNTQIPTYHLKQALIHSSN